MSAVARTDRYDDETIRTILRERWIVFEDEGELRERWDISEAELKRYKRRFPQRTLEHWTIEELVIGALYRSGEIPRAGLRSLAGWLDYMNHAAYGDDEVAAILDELVERGYAVRSGDAWRYNSERLAGPGVTSVL